MRFAFSLLPRISAFLFLAGAGCHRQPETTFQGYIEGEYVYVSLPLAGHLEKLAVARGDSVTSGQLLFQLEHQFETDAVREAASRLSQAESQLQNLRKGKRPSEIASLEAQLAEAKTHLALAQSEFDRRRNLQAGVISQEEVERSARAQEAQKARVSQLTADLETARLGARQDEITAAENNAAAQRAALDQANWALRQKAALAPAAGVVHDTLFRAGEWVPAGQPAVVLLPPENIKVRFFVPQPQLVAVRPGDKFRIRIDGDEHLSEGRIAFISTRAEFTPPVIYSDDRRAKLVYMVEGEFAPEIARNLKPGQPVEVIPDSPSARP